MPLQKFGVLIWERLNTKTKKVETGATPLVSIVCHEKLSETLQSPYNLRKIPQGAKITKIQVHGELGATAWE